MPDSSFRFYLRSFHSVSWKMSSCKDSHLRLLLIFPPGRKLAKAPFWCGKLWKVTSPAWDLLILGFVKPWLWIFFFFSLNVCKFGDADSSLPRMNENAQNLRWDVNSWQRYGEAQLGNFCGLCATVTSSLQRKAALPRIPLAEPTSHAVFLDGVSAVLQSV